MNDKHLEKLIHDIKRHEGYQAKVYRDTQGNLTCGWGHHLFERSYVPQDAADAFLANDIASAVNSFYRIDKRVADKLNAVRRRVIVNMIFNLGLSGVLGFRRMWTAIKKEDFDQAAHEMLDSQWARQVGHRAFELAGLMRAGHEFGEEEHPGIAGS
jgi:lysozyme